MQLRRRTLLGAPGAILAAPRIARAAERTRIILWHAMASTPGDELARLITKFNASQDDIEVTGLFKGVYKDLLTAVAAAWRAGQAPHIAQVFEVGTETMMSAGRVIKPVWQLAQETGVELDPSIYVPAVRGYYSTAEGHLMSMPFNSSTSICWYNQDAFEKAGLDPSKFPVTWPELVILARTIRDKQAAQYPSITSSVVWAHFEQFSSYPQPALCHRSKWFQRTWRGASDQQSGACAQPGAAARYEQGGHVSLHRPRRIGRRRLHFRPVSHRFQLFGPARHAGGRR